MLKQILQQTLFFAFNIASKGFIFTILLSNNQTLICQTKWCRHGLLLHPFWSKVTKSSHTKAHNCLAINKLCSTLIHSSLMNPKFEKFLGWNLTKLGRKSRIASLGPLTQAILLIISSPLYPALHPQILGCPVSC